ncbi:TauD/TfdA family dioxygenase [Mesorhizobium sp.]|uniref:TauD/TfdA family dioxygenase n=1 Tax=Mesorhizobium sp. TaxID=1871066 RepID=UPI00121E8FCB|nr:TauD/TfdA family dioxygenase [Mesorhizobium sp.]TIL31691.1 MAG: hypothetical protein E5Y82_29865 [Mesorhizobium sp.]
MLASHAFSDLKGIQRDLDRQDCALVDVAKPEQGNEEIKSDTVEAGILKLADFMMLGPTYTPSLYDAPTSEVYTQPAKFNHVGGPALKADHPAFSTTVGLDLHTDGTLNPIGEVQTCILGCVTEAAEGGDSVLFRAAALAESLLAEGADWLEPLFDPGALRRHTTVGETLKHADGPVLLRSDGRIQSRYCATPRDEWRYGAVPGLAQARERFEEAMTNSPDFSMVFRLRAGQALVMCNSRISHGRTEFRDKPGCARHMVRALFRSGPAVRQLVD